jgi:hypothetical protein
MATHDFLCFPSRMNYIYRPMGRITETGNSTSEDNPLEAVIATEAERAVAIRCVVDTAQYNRPDTEFADAAWALPV